MQEEGRFIFTPQTNTTTKMGNAVKLTLRILGFSCAILSKSFLSMGQSDEAQAFFVAYDQILDNIESIEYRTHVQVHHPGMDHIEKEVLVRQRLSDCKDIGFGNAKIFVDAIIDPKGKNEHIQYGYDGERFVFCNFQDKLVTIIENPDMKGVLRFLGFEYGMFHCVPLTAPDPFGKMIRGEYNSLKVTGKEKINDDNCACIQIDQNIGGQPYLSYRWFGLQDTMLYQIENTVDITTINYQRINYPSFADEFIVNYGSDFKVEYLTGHEPRTDGLLPLKSIAPPWMLKGIDKKTYQLKDFQGKLVLLDFWGTWCRPCVQFMPELDDLFKQYKDKGLVVIGVSVNDKPGVAAKFIEDKMFSYLIMEEGEKTAKDYLVKYFPTLYLIGKDGEILYSEYGGREGLKQTLEEVIQKNL